MAQEISSRPTRSRGNVRGQRAWARILPAARTVFARKGYADATLEDIAREAGMGKATLYRHVDSKAHLFAEMLLDQAIDPTPRIADALGRQESAEGQLRALAQALFDFWERHPDYRLVVGVLDRQDLIGEIPSDVMQRAEQRWRTPIEALANILRRGVDRGEFRPCDPWVNAHVIWNFGNLFFDLKSSEARRRMLGRSLTSFFEEGLELIVQGLLAKR